MKIKVSEGKPVEISREQIRPGFSTTTFRVSLSYAIVTGWFGTPSYREYPIRAGKFKRLWKQHRKRATGLVRNPLRLHDYFTINL